jgi:hypothetical protein
VPAETAAQDDAVTPVETSEMAAPPPTAEPEADPTPAPVAPNPAVAVNRLTGAELQDFLDRLWPAHRRAFEHAFGAHNSTNTNAEIAQLAGECSALLSRPEQHTDAIRRKLARIKKLTGFDGKARTKTLKSNAQLDHGALRRGLGLAGPTDQKFTTLNMTPDGTDASGNPVFAQLRGNRPRTH